MTEDPEFVAETLAWCNERRAEKLLPALSRMPQGKRNDPWSCPCGKATGLYVGGLWWGENEEDANESARNVTPQRVQGFIVAFDRGELPQYEDKEEA